MLNESDESVLGNVIAASIKKAGTDSSYIEVLYEAYKNLDVEVKVAFLYNITSYYDIVEGYKDINDTWKAYLSNNTESEALEIIEKLK